MRRALAIAAVLTLASCAEGGVNNGTIDNTNGSGGRADCISGVTCADPDCVDNDGDGFGTGCALGTDCDDNDAQAAPNVSEVCDGKDNNCNGRIDEGSVCSGPSNNITPTNNTTSTNNTNPGCVDADGDGYGTGCTAGADCDDSDPERFDGAPEACDGKDNDCDGSTDEDFEVGMACTAGLGVCAATGTLRCSADGTMDECSATAGPAGTEVCDNLDNDCDGTPDDGLNCNVCIEDSHEPDDSSLAGTTVNLGGSVSGQLCPGNVDWFRLGDYSAGQTVTVTAQFSDAAGDIDMEMYVGATFETGSYSGSDNETITRTLSKSGAVTIRLFFGSAGGASGAAYTVQR